MNKIHFLLATFFFSFLSLCLFSQESDNPFKEFGYNVLMATFSKGEYEEFHSENEIVEIGRVLFNTRTQEVVGFVEEEKEGGVEPATPAMSIDPLCEKYYWMSPYAYCMNNPVRYVDPDGRDGMVTGRGTKEDPYVITANYYYQNGSLNDAQVKGLNAAVDSYNKSGGKDGVKIKNADGSESYVKYNLSAQGVENVEQARLETSFETISGETMFYGNVVGTSPNIGERGDEFGSAHNFAINFNVENINVGIAEGMNSSSLNKGVAIHEMGHNLGGEHSDGTSVMERVITTTISNQLNSMTRTTYSYPNMSNKFTQIIFNKRDTPRIPFSGQGRLWTKKQP